MENKTHPISARSLKKSKRVAIVISIIWLAACAIGLWVPARYAGTPSKAGAAPAMWPPESNLQPSASVPTLVMLAHPRCPCTRASIGELAKIMTVAGSQVKAYVLFLRPEGFSEEWERTDLWRSAEAIPGVVVLSDNKGKEAANFGSLTSGNVLLYSPNGRLLFHGGITSSRGHGGDNEGEDAIFSFVANDVPTVTTTEVYGCSMVDKKNCPGVKVTNDPQE